MPQELERLEKPEEVKRLQQALVDLAATLRENHPVAFGDTPVPLAIGMLGAIRKRYRQHKHPIVETYLRRRCNTPAYLQACLDPEAVRYDLDGNPAGTVGEGGAAVAAERLRLMAEARAAQQIRVKTLVTKATLIVPLEAIPRVDERGPDGLPPDVRLVAEHDGRGARLSVNMTARQLDKARDAVRKRRGKAKIELRGHFAPGYVVDKAELRVTDADDKPASGLRGP